MSEASANDRERLLIKQLIADIDLKLADTLRNQQAVRLAPWSIGLTLAAALAGAFAAGAAFVKLLH